MKRRGFLAGLAAGVAALFASKANGTQEPRLVTDADGLQAIDFDGTSDALVCDPRIPKHGDPYPITFETHFDPLPSLSCLEVQPSVWRCTHRELRGQVLNLDTIMKENS